MASPYPQTSPRRYARITGVLYLVIFFLGPFAFFMGRSGVFVPGDPSGTIGNLISSQLLFRLGMVAETAIVLIEIVVSALLYVLLRPVSRPLALASSFARFAQSILQAVTLFTAVPALLLLSGQNYLSAFDPGQQNALVLLFMDINAFVIMIWGLLFGFHLLLLGYLVYRSGFWPKILGILLLIAALGYLAQSYGHIVVPQYDDMLAKIVVILSIPGELAFTLWLLIKGVNEKRWEERKGDSLR
ncbi:DUF4386 domain-containing protein [Sediminispirochaeta smaragdinae]|uniref:DUF4386 domain-containing protein n=1 Tax=Sediminispirochaeta smaragdinae (strain DSM 11293 / JCM 15392 / SEBR 4228) TaxID=573413 RepID=E1R867_SEDSS|nr:DUF4386 domain-containing protein [Sediminispirochaeta smaragdinae]ADK82922.1 conserved hypothetical protein [Sediminispirochaeta smaragdinae DSM 11293]